MKIDKLLPVGAMVLTCLLPRVAEACHEVTICVQFQTYTSDMGVGEFPEHTDYGVTVFPAKRVKVTVLPPPPEPPRQEITGDDGCFPLTTQYADGTKLFVHTEAFIGEPNPGEYNVRIASFPTCEEVLEEVDGQGGMLVGAAYKNLRHLVDGATVTPVIPAYDPDLRVFALANWVVAKFEDELNLPDFLNLALWTQDVSLWTNACDEKWCEGCGAFATRHEVFIEPGASLKKFIVGHELGHWLVQNWVGLSGGGFYSYPTIDDDCKFQSADPNINSLHGLRSAEYGSDAMNEGWAHFVSTYLFDDTSNPDARFKYYKDILSSPMGNYDDLIADNYLVSLLGDEVCDAQQQCHVLGGDLAWVENRCPNDWQVAAVSSEIDWMRFFWQLSSADADTIYTPEVTFENLLDIIDATGTVTPGYPALETAWPPGSLSRLQDIENITEVYNGN